MNCCCPKVGNFEEQLPKKPVGRLTINCWPTDAQQLANSLCKRAIYLSADSRLFVGEYRAANNFPAGAGQIVRSNLFLLGHIPFLAGQTSITSYRYKSAPSPLHMMFKYETSKLWLNSQGNCGADRVC